MWERKELKKRAKAVLKTNYAKAFLVSIVIALVGAGGGGGGGSSASNNNPRYSIVSNDSFYSDFTLLILAIGVVLLVAALRIFLGYPLEVGGRKYFVRSAQYMDNKKCFRYSFYRQNYKGIILTMLLKDVQNILWFLLLIIPGIVKGFAYSMVPYILADNPNIGCKKAIALSNKMTDGHKFNMFVLGLSFIGWYLLGTLALMVGVLFVLPYQNATYAELYLVLRNNVLESNFY